MKVAILGFSGGGKSTLARYIAETQKIPLLHLDTVQFTDNWQERNRVEARGMVKDYLNKADWVIDGNYSMFFQKERLKEANQIVLVQFSRWACLKRVMQRYLKYRHTTRPDMAKNCPESLDLPFVWWVLYQGRTKEKQAFFKSVSQQYPDKTVVLKNQKELDNFYTSLEN